IPERRCSGQRLVAAGKDDGSGSRKELTIIEQVTRQRQCSVSVCIEGGSVFYRKISKNVEVVIVQIKRSRIDPQIMYRTAGVHAGGVSRAVQNQRIQGASEQIDARIIRVIDRDASCSLSPVEHRAAVGLIAEVQ